MIIIFDLETYYASDYSLSMPAYNVSEYVRDPQFLIHGCAFKVGLEPAYWVAGHDQALKEAEQYEDEAMVAHNMAFDGFILHQHADIHPRRYCDTLSMARATMGHHMKHNLDVVARTLGFGGKTDGLVHTRGKRKLTKAEMKRLGAYCINDTERCGQIFYKLLEYMPEDEMRLIDLTLRMFCQPKLVLDEEKLRQEVKNEVLRKQAAIDETDVDKDSLMSNNKFAEVLRGLGVEPPLKMSLRTGKPAYAFAKTDKGFRQLLKHEDETIRLVAQARLEVKSTIDETRALRLLKAVPVLPVGLNYCAAHTTRWGGSNKLNLQNLRRGGELRKCIMAPPEHVLFVADLKQIEARINVWFCGQDDILQAFRDFDAGVGEDVYKRMASKLLGKKMEFITPDERFQGKTATLGMGFGMGHKRLRASLATGFLGNDPVYITEAEAMQQINAYRLTNPKIVEMWDKLNVLLHRMAMNPDFEEVVGPLKFLYKMIELPSGLALRYPGLNVTEDDYGRPQYGYLSRYGETKLWGGFMLENLCQALARCVIGEHMLAITRWPIATMTHDELVLIVPNEEIKDAEQEIVRVMTTSPVWAPDLPLAVDYGYDVRYSK